MKSAKFWIIVVLQVIFLIVIVARYHFALANGKTVLLKVVPVDPRDYLRGDFVVLSYEISTLNLDKIQHKDIQLNYNDTVYVRLEKGEKFWNALAVEKNKPDNNSELWLKGMVEYNSNKNIVRIKYGIEQFFVPENTGLNLERQSRDKISVEISVAKSGIGLIKQVYVDDKPVTLKPQR
jgi:uncharacterized membrane-anchored protein